MATRYDQFTKVRMRYSHQAQLRTRAVSPVVSASVSGTVSLTRYGSYTVTRSRGGGRGGYAIP